MRQILILILFSLMAFAPSVYAGFWDSALETVKDVTGPKEAGKAVGQQDGLTDQEILTGLREALNLGVQRAVKKASASGEALPVLVQAVEDLTKRKYARTQWPGLRTS